MHCVPSLAPCHKLMSPWKQRKTLADREWAAIPSCSWETVEEDRVRECSSSFFLIFAFSILQVCGIDSFSISRPFRCPPLPKISSLKDRLLTLIALTLLLSDRSVLSTLIRLPIPCSTVEMHVSLALPLHAGCLGLKIKLLSPFYTCIFVIFHYAPPCLYKRRKISCGKEAISLSFASVLSMPLRQQLMSAPQQLASPL